MSDETAREQQFEAIWQGFYGTGESLLRKENIQQQIDRAGARALQAPLITGWKTADGKGTYATSMVEQARFNALALARLEANMAVLVGLVTQLAAAATKGAPLEIDYKELAKYLPPATVTQVPVEYELIPKAATPRPVK